MEERQIDITLQSKFQESPFFVAKDPEQMLASVEFRLQQALDLPQDEKVKHLKNILSVAHIILSKKISQTTRINAHLIRLNISFELARSTRKTPEHTESVIQLKRFTKDSYSYLAQKSPLDSLRFLRVPLSGTTSTEDLKLDQDFVDWGVIAANKALSNEEIAQSANHLAYVVKARTELIKKRNHLIMQRKNRSN